MIIHDKEIGFLYTVGAFCDYNDYVVAHQDVSIATANLYKAEAMSRAYAKQHPEADVITVDELRDLTVYEFNDVVEAIKQAEEAGTTRKVETADTGKKRAKSS